MNRSAFAYAIAGWLLLALSPGVGARSAAIAAGSLQIIPLPRSVTAYPATYAVPRRIELAAETADERNVAQFAAEFFQERGIAATIVRPSTAAQVHFRTVGALPHGREAYELRVGPGGVDISAESGAGLFYGLQTLQQLFGPGSSNTIRQVDVQDAPSYGYRGMHLDVARHFFSVAFVEKYIDLLARYKLNIFHWHLTDDQGWRIAIKRYPKLTGIASCRAGSQIGHDEASSDGIKYCGYYTQTQIRDVVAYAKRRFVTIVPEIEMPGHSVEVLAAYPELACKPGRYAVRIAWGVSGDIVCPSERTIRFYENVLSEVIALFPGPYVHTGGDETPKTEWNASPLVRSLEARYHLKDADAVQGWFDTRIETFLRAHGKRMIGWDEILGGNISRSATIMSWRGTSGGVIAALRGNDVVMTPTTNLYFDYSQGDPKIEPPSIGGSLTLRDVYDYDPAIDGLKAKQEHHILGAQGNLWTEFVATPQKTEYMLLPRMLALAELTWTPSAQKDYDSFVSRTANQYARFEREGVAFRIPDPVGLTGTVTDKSSVTVTLKSPVPAATIYYTTGGSEPTSAARRYDKPFSLDLEPGEATLVRAITVLASGRTSVPAHAIYRRSSTEVTP